jgi:FMN reductase
VVGNPKPKSRTLAAARRVTHELTGAQPDMVLDLATLGATLLDWHDPYVTQLVTEVAAAELVVVASPTYKGTFTGLLKLFLDRFPANSMTGLAVPLMLGAAPGHALAPELSLRPVLTEIGASVPVRGLYVLDSAYDDPTAYADWLDTARTRVAAHLTPRRQGAIA